MQPLCVNRQAGAPRYEIRDVNASFLQWRTAASVLLALVTSLTLCLDTVEVCGSSPHGPTTLFLSFRWA